MVLVAARLDHVWLDVEPLGPKPLRSVSDSGLEAWLSIGMMQADPPIRQLASAWKAILNRLATGDADSAGIHLDRWLTLTPNPTFEQVLQHGRDVMATFGQTVGF